MICQYCGSESVEFIRSDDKNRWEKWQCNRCGMPLTANNAWDNEEMDYSFECSMCGKDMPPSVTGRCSSCEQVWNS